MNRPLGFCKLLPTDDKHRQQDFGINTSTNNIYSWHEIWRNQSLSWWVFIAKKTFLSLPQNVGSQLQTLKVAFIFYISFPIFPFIRCPVNIFAVISLLKFYDLFFLWTHTSSPKIVSGLISPGAYKIPSKVFILATVFLRQCNSTCTRPLGII